MIEANSFWNENHRNFVASVRLHCASINLKQQGIFLSQLSCQLGFFAAPRPRFFCGSWRHALSLSCLGRFILSKNLFHRMSGYLVTFTNGTKAHTVTFFQDASVDQMAGMDVHVFTGIVNTKKSIVFLKYINILCMTKSFVALDSACRSE